MRNVTFAIFIIMFFAAASCRAQEEHPIDKYLEDEIAKDWTTEGINTATSEAMEKWEAEMNKYYNKLLASSLSNDSKEMLKSAQAEWAKYRDLEFKNIDNIVGQLHGAVYATKAIANKNGIVKARALKLKEYYELLNTAI